MKRSYYSLLIHDETENLKVVNNFPSVAKLEIARDLNPSLSKSRSS